MRRNGLLCGCFLFVAVILPFIGTAQATPLRIVDGGIGAAYLASWDTWMDFTLSDGRNFSQIAPVSWVDVYDLDDSETFVGSSLWNEPWDPYWTINFRFFHKPMLAFADPPAVTSVSFTMKGTLSLYEPVYDEDGHPIGVSDPTIVDVEGQGRIDVGWDEENGNYYPTVNYVFLPEPASLVGFGLGLAGLISWKKRQRFH